MTKQLLMDASPTPPQAYSRADAHYADDRTDTALRGPALALARVGWLAVTVLAVGLLVATLPQGFEYFRSVCIEDDCFLRLTPDGMRQIAEYGLSAEFYAACWLIVIIVSAVVCCATAALLARRSTERMALFAALLLVLHGVGFGYPLDTLVADQVGWRWVAATLDVAAGTAFYTFPFLFPDGRFVPRWTSPLAAVALATMVARSFGPDWLDALELAQVFGLLLAGIVAQVHRYRRVSEPVQRQQTKWVVFGTTVALGGFVVLLALLFSFPSLPYDPLPGLAWQATLNGFLLLIPLSLALAILGHRLWDVDAVINRTLVFSALTACVIGLYVLVVGYLGTIFRTGGDWLVSLIATGLVAVLFQPLRERLQQAVNRLMYGERDEPYKALSRLGQQLEATLASEAVLPTIVENVARALKAPQAAIWLLDGQTFYLEAVHGEMRPGGVVEDARAVEALRRAPNGLRPVELHPSGQFRVVLAASRTALVLPLSYRGELVGALSLAPRSPGETFSPADRRLLRSLAAHAGAAAHSVQITIALRSSLEDLRRSRERLIVTQEEERRRIQRDLHDGLGPVLASMRLRLEACLDVTQGAPGPLAGNLERVYELVGEAARDIRRLVHDLRPPVLDQLGLTAALRQHCERFSRETGIETHFDAEAGLTFPAAAEMAIFRVVQEALVNVQKHAHASRIEVRLRRCDEWLTLEIRDDGVGFVDDGRAGTGIGSMRERAEVLGGTLRLASHPGAGTELTMRVPDSRR